MINVYYILPVWGGPMGFILYYFWLRGLDQPGRQDSEPATPSPSAGDIGPTA